MATIIKSSETINPPDLSDRIKAIEEAYAGFTVAEAESDVAQKKADIDQHQTMIDRVESQLRELQSDLKTYEGALEEAECILSMAVGYEAAIELAKSQFTADQLKQDYDHTIGLLRAAIENSGDETEVTIEVLGDVIPARHEHEGNLWLHTVTDKHGNATYAIKRYPLS